MMMERDKLGKCGPIPTIGAIEELKKFFKGDTLRGVGEELYIFYRDPGFPSLSPECQRAIRLVLEAVTSPKKRGVLAATMVCRHNSSNKKVAEAREKAGLYTKKLPGWCFPLPWSNEREVPCRVHTPNDLARCKKFVTHGNRVLWRKTTERLLTQP